MKIAMVAAGAAGAYCGSCLRDNALARAMIELGHEVTFIPTYTPLRLDEDGVEHTSVFLGGVQVFLEDKLPSVRRPGGLLRRALGSERLLRWVSRMSASSRPEKLGRLTVSMLRGSDGNLRTSFLELIEWLGDHARPDVVHLSNSLLSGLAPEIAQAIGVPVTCGLSGEDVFLEGLAEPHRSQAFALVAERGTAIDRFIAPSRAYADRMVELCGLDREKMAVVLPGIRLDDYERGGESAVPRGSDGLTIGFLARISPEKGVHLLADAFRRLTASEEFARARLRIAGYLGGDGFRYAAFLRRQLATAGLSRQVEILGTLDRAQKLRFLREIDVFVLPSVTTESKGLPVLEALASGVPVVVSRQGSLPELVEATGGGVVHESGDPEDLAAKLADLLRDHEGRRAMTERGRASIFEKFSARRMAEDTMAVFAKLKRS